MQMREGKWGWEEEITQEPKRFTSLMARDTVLALTQARKSGDSLDGGSGVGREWEEEELR